MSDFWTPLNLHAKSYSFNEENTQPTPTPTPTPINPNNPSVPDAASNISLVAIAPSDWSANAFFGIGTPFRAAWNNLESWVGRGGAMLDGNTFINRWDSSAQNRGQYFVSRHINYMSHALSFAVRGSKSIVPLREAQRFWNRVWLVRDRSGGINTTVSDGFLGWSLGTGGGESVSQNGERIILESSVSACGFGILALMFHLNRHLDPSFADTRDEILAYWRNHFVESHKKFYNNNVMTDARPLIAQKDFSHSALSEIVGLLCIAKIEGGESGWANTLSGRMAILALNRWIAVASTTTLIQTDKFRDQRNAATRYGPARVWGQRTIINRTTYEKSQFLQPNTYLNETFSHLFFLYAEGLITRCLGSQNEANIFAQQLVSTLNVVAFPEETRLERKWPMDLRGSVEVNGVWTPAYTNNPIGGGGSRNYRSVSQAMGNHTIFSVLDATRRSGDLRRAWHSAEGSRNQHSVFCINLLEYAYQDGRLR